MSAANDKWQEVVESLDDVGEKPVKIKSVKIKSGILDDNDRFPKGVARIDVDRRSLTANLYIYHSEDKGGRYTISLEMETDETGRTRILLPSSFPFYHLKAKHSSDAIIDFLGELNELAWDFLRSMVYISKTHDCQPAIKEYLFTSYTALLISFSEHKEWVEDTYLKSPFLTKESKLAIRKCMRQIQIDEILGEIPKGDGFLYLIQADLPGNPCKIGKSTNVSKRLNLFGVKLPFDFELLHIIPVDNHHLAEIALHNRYASNRTSGEWFDLSDEDIANIQNITGYARGEFIT